MKKASLLIGAALLFTACSETEKPEVGDLTTDETSEAEAVVYTIDAANSTVNWTGSMLGMYDHFGTLAIKEGTVTVKEGMIVSGSITVDMTSMMATDENYNTEEGKTPENLVGHLSSPDFFDVATYPTATFNITGSDGNNVVGKLTVKGNSNEEIVTDLNIDVNESGLTARGNMTFNRQVYGVSYAVDMADMVISDDIVMELSLTAKE